MMMLTVIVVMMIVADDADDDDDDVDSDDDDDDVGDDHGDDDGGYVDDYGGVGGVCGVGVVVSVEVMRSAEGVVGEGDYAAQLTSWWDRVRSRGGGDAAGRGRVGLWVGGGCAVVVSMMSNSLGLVMVLGSVSILVPVGTSHAEVFV